MAGDDKMPSPAVYEALNDSSVAAERWDPKDEAWSNFATHPGEGPTRP